MDKKRNKRGTALVRRIRAGRIVPIVAIGWIAILTTGCQDFLDQLLDVQAPSRVPADALADPQNAGLLLNGAVADFECAFAHYVVAGGLVGNELEVATTLIVMKEYDKRDFAPVGSAYTNTTCDSGGAVGVYIPLSVARWQADNILNALEDWTDQEVSDRTEMIATAAAYSGYSHVLMGEGMCSVAFDLGPELSRMEVFERAEARFTRALAAAEVAGRNDLVQLALVGRARARLNLGRPAEAAADARLVPMGFIFNSTYSTHSPRRENAVFTRNFRIQTITIDPSYRDLAFAGTPDPRVTVTDAGGPASDGVTRLWTQTKYTTPTSSIPMATWEEAQLIIAEAELVSGNVEEAVDIINVLHARAGLPDFNSSDPAEVMSQLLYERRAELFLESHHLGDVNRYDLPLTPAPGTPFKDGGGDYMDQTCFPLPEIERGNNPSI